MIFDVDFRAPIWCVVMGMLNFMELMWLYVQVHSWCWNKLFWWFLLN